MGSSGLERVRFNRRYYLRHHQLDRYFEFLGEQIVRPIPTDSEKYQKWLKAMRDEYAARENTLETHVYTIRNGVEPDYSQFREFMTLPSEFPRLGNNVQYFYIINLDQEVLTDDYGIHLALNHFPRHDDLWIRAVADGIYEAGLLPFLTPTWKSVWPRRLWTLPGENSIGYDLRVVTPKTDLAEARKTFLTHILANTLVEYKKEIIRFGLDWSPDSLSRVGVCSGLDCVWSGQFPFLSRSAV